MPGLGVVACAPVRAASMAIARHQWDGSGLGGATVRRGLGQKRAEMGLFFIQAVWETTVAHPSPHTIPPVVELPPFVLPSELPAATYASRLTISPCEQPEEGTPLPG